MSGAVLLAFGDAPPDPVPISPKAGTVTGPQYGREGGAAMGVEGGKGEG